MRSRSWLIGLVVLVSAGTSSADGSRVLAANGVEMVAPSGWKRVAPAPSGITDPVTVLVGGTRGVRFRLVPCQVAAYRIPARGAAVVVVRWRTETSGGGSPDRSRAPLRHIVLNRRGFECWPRHRGGAVQLALRGHAYQVNVLIGDRASRRVVAQALSVARSFDLVH
jgi:hypothetical protein